MLDLFASWGCSTSLISHQPSTPEEQETSALLVAKADKSVLMGLDEREEQQVRSIVRFLRKEKPQIFIPNYRLAPWAAAARISRKQVVQVVGVCHSDDESYYRGLGRYMSILSFCVCPSTKTLNEMRRRIPESCHRKLKYISHYVRPKITQRAEFVGSPFTVIYHGRLREEQKHVSEILKIAARVCAADSRIQFRFIGDDQESGLYGRLIRERGLEKNCTILPPQDWMSIQVELARAQLSILTSSYEGFCYTAAEALALGLPVVAYDCGNVISDFVHTGENGFIVPWGGSEELAVHILELSGNPEEWNRLSCNALATARDLLDFRSVSNKYHKAVTESPVPPEGWPRLRPTYIPPAGKSLRSFIERMGVRFSVW